MGKVYNYTAKIPVADQDPVTISIELPDKGTSICSTGINTPAGIITIKDEGSEVIGKGADLKSNTIVIASNPINPAPEIDVIRVNIYANGQLVGQHSNTKTVTKTPQIMVYLTIQ